LQKIDVELDKHRAMLAEVNAKLANNPAVKQAQASLAAAQSALAEARRAAKVLDDENKTLSAHITDAEERLYGGSVRNPRELQDLQNDIDSLKRNRNGLDEKQLAAIEAVEAAEKQEAAARAVLAEAEAARAVEQGDLIRDKGAVDAILEKLGGEREAALISVNPEDLATYDTLRRQKRVAVGLLVDGTCTACGVAPSSSRIMAARAGGDLVRCGNCGRILYAEHGVGHIDTGDKEDEMIHRW
jgi:predicted  nucleic acid-binding Zn-ribbon protein